MKKLFFPQTEDAGRGGVFTSFLVNYVCRPPPWGAEGAPSGGCLRVPKGKNIRNRFPARAAEVI